jgi:hypothetical protein
LPARRETLFRPSLSPAKYFFIREQTPLFSREKQPSSPESQKAALPVNLEGGRKRRN